MREPIWTPLSSYHLIKDEHQAKVRSYLDQAIIDLGFKPETAHEIADKIEELKSKISVARSFLYLSIAISTVIVAISIYISKILIANLILKVIICFAIISLLLCITVQIRNIYLINNEKDDLSLRLGELHNSIKKFLPRDFFNKISYSSLPAFEVFPYLSVTLQKCLRDHYGCDLAGGESVATQYVHAGVLGGNPFIVELSTSMTVKDKVYVGSKVIKVRVPTYVNGKRRMVTQSQVVSATISEPAPFFEELNRVVLASDIAKDLSFSHGKMKPIWDLGSGRDNLSLLNAAFEKSFGANDRDNEHQFRLLFTPLAQEQMQKALSYIRSLGHSLSIQKDKHIFLIQSDMLSEFRKIIAIDLSERQFDDFADFRRSVWNFSEEAFKFIFFSLSPLLCIPILQRLTDRLIVGAPSPADPPSDRFLEAMAYWVGEDHFKHASSATQNILKACSRVRPDGRLEVSIAAHGFKTIPRRSWGYTYAYGRKHRVPIDWIEYKPVCRTTKFVVEQWANGGGNGPLEAVSKGVERLRFL